MPTEKLSDIFGEGRHIYTFENYCREDKSIRLDDGTTKIFLNASGTKEDVSQELKNFLDYLKGIPTDDPYVQELDRAVRKAKRNRKWRHEYMTLAMRDQENFERGLELGKTEGNVKSLIKLLSSRQQLTEELRMEIMEQKDAEILEQWFDCALVSDSLEDFLKKIGKATQ